MQKILVAITATLCLSTAAFAEEPRAEVVAPPKAEVPPPPAKEAVAPPNTRHASWIGGHGSRWQTGPHSYGFEGYFAGCHYVGHAGPHGYHLDKLC